jgi:two-component system response regulator AtoC
VCLIADHFLNVYRNRYDKPRLRMSTSAERWLRNHTFPGNIRELRNAMERAVLLSDGESVDVEDLAIAGTGHHTRTSVPETGLTIANFGEIKIEMPPWGIAIEDVERKLILAALDAANGNVTRAAELLHISRDTLRYRLKKFGLSDPP